MTTNSRKSRISRRDFLKLGVASGSALIFGNLLRENAEAANTFYWGTDSGSASCLPCAMPQNFYIGKTGEGLIQISDYFNTTAAEQCPSVWYVHSWWWLYGPNNPNKPASSTNYQWGKNQAQKACDAWYTHPYASYFYGKTIFCDIEEYYGDWSTSNKTANRDVLRGFLDGVATYTRNGVNPGFVPGIYTRADLWQTYFGTTGYKTPRAAALWIAGCACNINCGPCDPCPDTLTQASAKMESTMSKFILGGNKAVIWQYWISDCGCGDYDVSINQDGYKKFTPLTSTTYWNKPSC